MDYFTFSARRKWFFLSDEEKAVVLCQFTGADYKSTLSAIKYCNDFFYIRKDMRSKVADFLNGRDDL